jgi:hypothetical protein
MFTLEESGLLVRLVRVIMWLLATAVLLAGAWFWMLR